MSFEGVVLDNILNDFVIDLDDAIEDEFVLKEDSNQTFVIPLPTRIVVHAEKHFSSTRVKNKETYNKHSIYLTYIQGLDNTAGRTTKPYVAGGYAYSLKNILNIGPTLNYGGYGGLGMGMFLSAKAGAFKIGFGTNTGLLYLLGWNAKSVDFSFAHYLVFWKGSSEACWSRRSANYSRKVSVPFLIL